jgi:hypothetical protein
MRFQNLVHIARAVSRNGSNLRDRATGQGKARHSRPAQVVEVQILVTGLRALESFAPLSAEAIARPWFTERVAQYGAIRLLWTTRVKHGF